MRDIENYDQMDSIAESDVQILRQKGKGYGRSWIKRGGIGAFMMLARKWDRVENSAQRKGYDILSALAEEGDDLLDDIADLRRYLLLVESEYLDRLGVDKSEHLKDVITGAPIPEPGSTRCNFCHRWNYDHSSDCLLGATQVLTNEPGQQQT